MKLRNLLSALPLLAIASPLMANNNDGGTPPPYARAIDVKQPFSLLNPVNKGFNYSNEYFVMLNDLPLALHSAKQDQASISSIDSATFSFKNANGKLNAKSPTAMAYRSQLAAKQTELKLHMELSLKRPVEFSAQYNVAVNGFVTTLSPIEVIQLKQNKNIKAIEKLEVAQLDTDSGPIYSGAGKVWSGTNTIPATQGEGIVVGIIDSGIASFLEKVTLPADLQVGGDRANLPSFHPSFSPVSADGYEHINPYGEDVFKGDCIDQPGWCNSKLVGVYTFGRLERSLINRDINEPRSLKGQDAHGHGTHTASTVAGNLVYNVNTDGEIGGPLSQIYPQNFTYEQISGVAPRANIISYKTCNSHGSCYPDLALLALEQAIIDKVDVINYSISSNPQSPWYSVQALAFLSAREAGLHIAASAGNSGMGGLYTVRTPANSPWITSVAANTHDRGFDKKIITLIGGNADYVFPEQNVAEDNEEESDGKILPIVAENQLIGEGATNGLVKTDIIFAKDVEHINAVDDYGIVGSCAEGSIPKSAVQGKVVICNRGGHDLDGNLSRAVKSFVLHQLGAAGMVLINTKDSSNNIEADMHSIPSIHLDKKNAQVLIDWLAEGENHQVEISKSTLITESKRGDIMANFSSKGPDLFSLDYMIPSISGPGVSVLAGGLGKGMQDTEGHEYYKTDRDFVYKSGTSMSTPHVTGMYALIKAIHPSWTPAEAQSALMLTAGTELKVVEGYDEDKFEYTFEPAPLHYTGAGLAKVDVAIKSGLIMSETSTGYLLADPYGDDQNIRPVDEDNGQTPEEREENFVPKEVPDGWHGDTSKINLASMSKGACEQSCSWKRTFEATKSATWQVSFSYTTEGMELTADQETISIEQGKTFDLNITATLTNNLDSVWSYGRVHLTSTDPSLPPVSLPVSVEFKSGSVPKEINITSHRSEGSIKVDDIYTKGSEHLTAIVSQLSDSIMVHGEVERSTNPRIVWEGEGNFKNSLYFFPLNIQSGAERLVVEILNTTSPDLDIYIGRDSNLNGQAEVRELGGIYYSALGAGSLEKLDALNPVSGDYWVLIYNYGNAFNDEESERFNPDYVVYDEFSIAVSVVYGDDDSLKVVMPEEALKDEIVPVTLSWQKEMQEGERLYGSLSVSSLENESINIGTSRINMTRGEDDVRLSLLENNKATTQAGFNINFSSNQSGKDKVYQLSAELTVGTTIEAFSTTTTIDGVGLQTQGEAIEFEQEGNTLTWSLTQADGASAQTQTLIFNYNQVSGNTDITPVVTSILNDSEHTEYANMEQQIMVQGRPAFAVDVSNVLADEGDVVTLTASTIDAVIENARVNYRWKLVSTHSIDFDINYDVLTFTAPKTSTPIIFEMIGTNGEQDSNPMEVAIHVDSEESSSGGSLWSLLLLFAFISGARGISAHRSTLLNNNK